VKPFANKAPFPWFGGKSDAAPTVWKLLGDVEHYIEPFAGSLAVLLGRPHPANRKSFSETVNDLDGFICNTWRAIHFDPVTVAHAASWPVIEADKTARQIALLRWRDSGALERLAGDACWYDPIMAGWWLWAVAVQIGAFTGDGPWTADPHTGQIYKRDRNNREPGVSRGRPHIGDNGMGVNHPGLREPGVQRDLPHIVGAGQGVNHPGLREPGVLESPTTALSALDGTDWGECFHDQTMPGLVKWMRYLSARLRHVRVLNGDWKRAVTTGASRTLSVRQGGHCGIFLDPPYADTAERRDELYGCDSLTVAHDVREWCLANTDRPNTRIVLAGFDGEHGSALVEAGWTEHEWFRTGFMKGGMSATKQQHRERLWASPQCLSSPGTTSLFDEE